MLFRLTIAALLFWASAANAVCGLTYARLATGTATRGLPPDVYAIFARAHDAGGGYVATPAERETLGRWGELFDTYNRASRVAGVFRSIDRAAALWRRSDLRLRTTTWAATKSELAPMLDAFRNLRRVRATKIYEKIARDPAAALTDKERERIASLFLTRDLELFRQSAAGGTPPPPSLLRAWAKENWSAFRRGTTEMIRLPIDMAFKAAGLVLPLPGRAMATLVKRRMIAKLLRDPAYDPTGHFTKKFHLEEEIDRFKRDLEIHGEAFARINLLRNLGEGLKWALVFGAAGISAFPDHTISTRESFDEGLDEDEHGDAASDRPGYRGMSRNQRRRVTILYTSPLPHASIRIGGLVYNYGQNDVTVMRLEEYEKMVGFGEAFSGNHTRVELNLTPEQIAGLRAVLERDVERGKYTLIFPFNDCIAMVNGALREGAKIDVPPVADRSQSLSIGYFRGLRAAGSQSVGDVIFATRDDRAALHRAADTAANVADTLYFTRNALHLALFSKFYDRIFGTSPNSMTGDPK